MSIRAGIIGLAIVAWVPLTVPTRVDDRPSPVQAWNARPEAPDRVGEFERVSRILEDPELGVHSRYEASNGDAVDVYVYPVPLPDAHCPVACLQAWVDDEADGFAEYAPEQLRQAGRYASMTLLSDSVVHVRRRGTSAGRHLVFTVTDPGGVEGVSDFLLVGFEGYRVKVRRTIYGGSAVDATALGFFRKLLLNVEPAYACEHGLSETGNALSIQTTVPMRPERFGPIADSVLISLGYEPKSRRNGWIALPRFEWPEGTPAVVSEGREAPGYQVLLSAEPVADSTRYSVTAPMVCEPAQPLVIEDQPASRVLELLVTARIQASLAEALERSPE